MLRILNGDALEMLRTLPDESVNCCVTSPPYYGLRDYGAAGQIGLESTPEQYVERLVAVFREVRRVLRDDGTLWLNVGDSYADKNLIGIPWMLAFALRADGWYLRQDIIWAKPNPMPESVRDRCTKAHEYIFLLTKSARYWYDAEAVREDIKPWNGGEMSAPKCGSERINGTSIQTVKIYDEIKGANRRSVWNITTKPYKESHFATFPPELPRICIMAGCPADGVVLDPFAGSGTTGAVALELGRSAMLIELNTKYVKLIERRTQTTVGLAI